MDEKYREYHQYTSDEFKQLWQDSIFVFDTNTLLNMYRYSRKTVDAYLKALNDLKSKGQLWIPYQVGYEFYENRIDVIKEYEKSYDEILRVIEKAKSEVETKYKNHPFLDFEEIRREMTKGLNRTEEKIRKAQAKHPQWLKNDDVLEALDKVFKGSIGDAYDESQLSDIASRGAKRYAASTPPGFKDNKKPDDKKYGDLILWFQIIDHVKKINKPVIFVTGDVKEDWWLQKDGRRIMPLPQLKKEMLEEAGVEFHMYTADKFLELYESGEKQAEHSDAVEEVRKLMEFDKTKEISNQIELINTDRLRDSSIEDEDELLFYYGLKLVQDIVEKVRASALISPDINQLESIYRRLRVLRHRPAHILRLNSVLDRLIRDLGDVSYISRKILVTHPEPFTTESYSELTKSVDSLDAFLSALRSDV